MNCCDDYGNCRQGRDCPARRESDWPTVAYRTGSKRLDSVLQAISYGVAVLGALCLVAAVIALLGMMGGLSR